MNLPLAVTACILVAAWVWWLTFALLRVSEAVKRTNERLDALAATVSKLKAVGVGLPLDIEMDLRDRVEDRRRSR